MVIRAGNPQMPHPAGPTGQLPPGFAPRYPMRPRFGPQPPLVPPRGFAQAPPVPVSGASGDDFDGKRLRKSVMRKTVDYNSSFMGMIERRIWQRDARDRRALQPDPMFVPDLMPPVAQRENPANAVVTKFVKTATNKMRCPVFTLAWTPEGRRLITGASSGEFTLWNGLTFNFETILQAHDSPVRAMVWSNSDQYMVTGDHSGYVKYWQSNMNNVKMFQAHKEPVRCISFSPTDNKFATCSDDGTVRIFDFFAVKEEKVLRGHGSDVKCVAWHPFKGLVASGSKDNQQPVKIWEPKSGQVLTTLHAHKSTVMDVKWNANGNWLLTASRDHLLKLFDIRNCKEEVQTFRGHKKEASVIAWHPVHEGIFASGGSDGSIMFWQVGADKEVGVIESAHESIVWALAWHPIGHILCSGSNDHTCKFWTRNRPGDTMRDKYNLNTMPQGQEEENSAAGNASTENNSQGASANSFIPGMGPEDRVEGAQIPPPANYENSESNDSGNPYNNIPGFDNMSENNVNESHEKRKTPFSKPIPRNFQASWNALNNQQQQQQQPTYNMMPPPPQMHQQQQVVSPWAAGAPPLQQQQQQQPPQQQQSEYMSLNDLQRQTTAVVALGRVLPVLPGSNLHSAIAMGERAVKDVIRNELINSNS